MVAKNVKTNLLQPEIVNSGTKSINVLEIQGHKNGYAMALIIVRIILMKKIVSINVLTIKFQSNLSVMVSKIAQIIQMKRIVQVILLIIEGCSILL